MRVVLALALLSTAGCGTGATPPDEADLAIGNDETDGGAPDLAAPGTGFRRIVAGTFVFAAAPTIDLLLLGEQNATTNVAAYTPAGTLLHSFGNVTVRAVYGNRAVAIDDGASQLYWWPSGTSPAVSPQTGLSAISADGLYVAAYGPFGDGGNVLVAGARDHLELAADVGPVAALAFSPVGHHLYVLTQQRDLYRFANGDGSSTPVRVASSVASDLAFSADGQSLAVTLLPAGGGPGTVTIAPTTFAVDDAINTSGTRAPAADAETPACPRFVPQRSLVAYAGVVNGAPAARTFDFTSAATQTLTPTVAPCADAATTAWIGYGIGSGANLWGLASGSWFSPPEFGGEIADYLASGVFALELSSMTINTYQVYGPDFAHLYDCARGHYGSGSLIDDARSIILTGAFTATGPELDLCSASGTTSLVPAPVRSFAYGRMGKTLYYILDDGVYAGPL